MGVSYELGKIFESWEVRLWSYGDTQNQKADKSKVKKKKCQHFLMFGNDKHVLFFRN